jgi:hypothetical protein
LFAWRILFDCGDPRWRIDKEIYIPGLLSSRDVNADSANSALSAYRFRLGLLDAETLKFAAPGDWKSKLFAQRLTRNITQIGQSRDPAVALFDSDASTVIPGNTNSKQQNRKG